MISLEVRVREELERIRHLGWQPVPLNVPGNLDESTISFPNELEPCTAEGDGLPGFWNEHRMNLVYDIISEAHLDVLWEVGSGSGAVALGLMDRGVAVLGVEPVGTLASHSVSQGVPTFHSTLDGLHLPDGSVSAIGLFDVLEHIERPSEILAEIIRVLRPGGLVVVTVPASPALFSRWDIELGHFRRYTARDLRSSLTDSGFTVKSCSYFFLFLWPLALMRKLRKRNTSTHHSCSHGFILAAGRAANSIGSYLARAESRLLRSMALPFGSSLIAVAMKE